MKLTFYDSREFTTGFPIVTVYKNGQVRISKKACHTTKLKNGDGLLIGTNEEDQKDKSIYFVRVEPGTKHSFKLREESGGLAFRIRAGLFMLIGVGRYYISRTKDQAEGVEGELFRLTKDMQDVPL